MTSCDATLSKKHTIRITHPPLPELPPSGTDEVLYEGARNDEKAEGYNEPAHCRGPSIEVILISAIGEEHGGPVVQASENDDRLRN